mgnify:CR=1 FL=1
MVGTPKYANAVQQQQQYFGKHCSREGSQADTALKSQSWIGSMQYFMVDLIPNPLTKILIIYAFMFDYNLGETEIKGVSFFLLFWPLSTINNSLRVLRYHNNTISTDLIQSVITWCCTNPTAAIKIRLFWHFSNLSGTQIERTQLRHLHLSPMHKVQTFFALLVSRQSSGRDHSTA